MKISSALAVLVVALLSFGVIGACDSEVMKKEATGALEEAKGKLGDLSLDGLKKRFNEFGIADIEAKAREMGKLDVPAIKNLLTEKLNVEKLIEGIDADNMIAKIKELAPRIESLGELVKQARTALGI